MVKVVGFRSFTLRYAHETRLTRERHVYVDWLFSGAFFENAESSEF